MKIHTLASTLLLLTSPLLHSQPASTFASNHPEDQLLAYYPFNGTARDETGHGYDGVVNGAVLAPDRFGLPAHAFSFNGVTDYIQVPLGSAAFSQDFTISLWANLNNYDQSWPWLIYGENGFINLNVIGKASGTAFPERIGELSFGFDVQPGAVTGLIENPTPTDLHKNIHVAIARRGDTVSMFYNGNLVGTGQITLPLQSGHWLLFGRGHLDVSSGYAMEGTLDDIRIYARSLADHEIFALYARESAGPEPCVPHRAAAIATVSNGILINAAITDAGCGYERSPVVSIVGGAGKGATATANIEGGLVTSITITNPGHGYSEAPSIRIASPPFAPWVWVAVSKVRIEQHVTLGRKCVLEFSDDLRTWEQIGNSFLPDDEQFSTEVEVTNSSRAFRIREVQ